MSGYRSLVFAVFVLAVGLIVSVDIGNKADRKVQEKTVQDAVAVAADASETWNLLIRNLKLVALTTSNRVDPNDLLQSSQEAVTELAKSAKKIRTVIILDEAGTVVADMRPNKPAVGLDVSDRSYFTAHKLAGSPAYYLGSPVSSRVDGNWTIPLSVAIRDSQGDMLSVVVVSVEAKYFGLASGELSNAGLFGAVVDERTEKLVPLNCQPCGDEQVASFDAGLQAHREKPNATSWQRELQTGIVFGSTLEQPDLSVLVFLSGEYLLMKRKEAYYQALLSGAGGSGFIAFLCLAVSGGWLRIRNGDRKTARLESRLKVATEAACVGIWEYDFETERLSWDATMFEIYDVPRADFDGTFDSWRRCVHPEDLVAAQAVFQEAVLSSNSFAAEFRIVHRDGTVRHIEAKATISRNPTGNPIKITGANYDVTELKQREQLLQQANERIEREARRDPLTGLLNRRGLTEALLEHEGQDWQQDIYVFSLDLDGFKQINDAYGHEAGDAVLKSVASSIKSVCGQQDTVARMGGDEFLCISQTPSSQALAETLLDAVKTPATWNGLDLCVGASLGYAPVVSEQPMKEILGHADLALYAAKASSANRIAKFTPDLADRHSDRIQLAEDIKLAFNRNEFVPFFQPQLLSDETTLFGVEVLARWRHPDRGLLAPGVFLPVAEMLKLTADIDLAMLRAVIRLILNATDGPLADIPRVSINIEAQSLLSDRLLAEVAALPVSKTCRLSFEIVESVFVDDVDTELIERVDLLKAHGASIEIDDFGSGHASITSILALQPDYIKLDRTFTQGIATDKTRRSVVNTLVRLGQTVNTPVIAEGIERQRQAHVLREMGCHALQGYLYAKPMPVGDLANWLVVHSGTTVEKAAAS